MSAAKEKRSKCPHCAKPTPSAEETRFCPHCNGPLFEQGFRIDVPHCSLCFVQLRAVCVEGGDEALICPKCHGLWLDRISFDRAVNPHRIPQKYAQSNEHWFRFEKRTVQYLPCPRCGRFMNRENFAAISGIVVDTCRDHGIWLDQGELERIRLFVVSGGLDRLRDKRLDKLEGELSSLALRTSSLEFMEQFLFRWNLKRIAFRGTIF